MIWRISYCGSDGFSSWKFSLHPSEEHHRPGDRWTPRQSKQHLVPVRFWKAQLTFGPLLKAVTCSKTAERSVWKTLRSGNWIRLEPIWSTSKSESARAETSPEMFERRTENGTKWSRRRNYCRWRINQSWRRWRKHLTAPTASTNQFYRGKLKAFAVSSWFGVWASSYRQINQTKELFS